MLNPDFRDMLSEFSAAGVEYLIVGGYAVAHHGYGVEFDDAYPSRVVARVDDVDIPFVGLQHLLQNKRATGRSEDAADADQLEKARRGRAGSGE
jgi:hypothetical protein